MKIRQKAVYVSGKEMLKKNRTKVICINLYMMDSIYHCFQVRALRFLSKLNDASFIVNLHQSIICCTAAR